MNKTTEFLIQAACTCVIGYVLSPVIGVALAVLMLNPWLIPLFVAVAIINHVIIDALRRRAERKEAVQ